MVAESGILWSRNSDRFRFFAMPEPAPRGQAFLYLKEEKA